MFLPLDPAGRLLSPVPRFVPLLNNFLATPLKGRKEKGGIKRENVRGSRRRGPFGVGRGKEGKERGGKREEGQREESWNRAADGLRPALAMYMGCR